MQDYDFRRYDGVWRRVEPTLEPYPQDATERGSDPCCMGTAAAEYAEVLAGYVAEERADRAWYLALARVAPQWARETLRALAADEAEHAKTLEAAQYLIGGSVARTEALPRHDPPRSWLEALREAYHDESCTAMNYERSAEETTDACLAKLLGALGADEYRHAETVLGMLKRSMGARR